MDENDNATVRFADGFVFNKNMVLIASQLVALEDYDHSRIFNYKDGQWKKFDLDMVVWSICGVETPARALFSMSRDGQIDVSSGGSHKIENVRDAGVGPGKLGYVNQIAGIAGQLYVCGGSGQIYRRDSKGWEHFDQGVLDKRGDPDAIDLLSISGTSGKDIYSVGKHGLIFHYDGKSWHRSDSPAPYNLYSVRCLSPAEVYICGDSGAFFKGYGNRWENYSRPDLNEEFSAVEIFQDVPYLAAPSGLYKFNGQKIEKVSTKLNPAPDGFRLHANDGVLWSFGTDHLCYFDGKKWTYVKHPDNP